MLTAECIKSGNVLQGISAALEGVRHDEVGILGM